MIIRELITKLGFSVDSASLKKAEDSIDGVKKKLVSVRAPKGGIMINDFFYKGGRYIPKGIWEQVENGTANVNRNLNQLGDSAESAGSKIKQMVQAYFTFASVTTLARVADAAQSLRARLAMVPQTIGDAGAAFDELAERANFARTSIDAYGQLYVRLAGATKDYFTTQEEVLEITDAISQALTINGATTQEAASVTLQLSQAFQKGKLDGDEFRAFMEGLSTDFKEKMVVALQDVTGNANITVGALYDMSASGELVAKDLALAFKKMAPEIRKQMLSIPLTIGGATQIVRNDFTAMIDRMNRESMAVTRIAGTIVKGFDLIETGIYKVKDVFGGFGNVVSFTGSLIATIITGKILKSLIDLDKKTFLLRLKWIGMAAAVVAAALVIEDVFRFINGQASATAKVIDYLIDRFSTLRGFLNFGEDVKNIFGSWAPLLLEKAGVQPGMLAPQVNNRPLMGFTDVGARPPQSNRYEVNVTLPPGSTPDQVPLWTAEVEKAIDKTIARNITSTVGGR